MLIAAETKGINTLDFEISNSAYVFLGEEWKCNRVCDPITRLYYVRSGKGFLNYSGGKIEMTGGNVYIVPSELEFSYGCEKLEKLYFHISVYGIERYDLLKSINCIYSMPFSEAEFFKLLNLYKSDDYLDFLKLKLTLYQTVADFAKRYNFSKIPVKSYSETVRKTIEYIQKNLRLNLSLQEISDALFVSASKIRTDFKKEMGVTIGKYKEDLVFLKAKNLLGMKNVSLKDISDTLGFCDRFYFSRRFKERYKKMPSQYRKEISII